MIQIAMPRTRRKARIEIVPLIDIVFFLLATFVMVSLSMVKNQGLPIKLPSAASSKTLERGEAVILRVSRDGAISWDKRGYSQAELSSALESLHASRPDARVVIQGDERAEYGKIVSVLDRVRQAGLTRVAVQTAKP
jgi:biopolymer transport protein ExbD